MVFERKINLSALKKGARTLKFDAGEAERLALAARFDLIELIEFKGDATVTAEKGDDGVVISGQFRAKLAQRCSITLEPVWDKLSEGFRVRLVRLSQEEVGVELELDPENDEDIEVLEGEEIDIGEIAAQYLGIAVNPYPRKKGGDADDLDFAGGKVMTEEKAREMSNPFSSLKKLRDRD